MCCVDPFKRTTRKKLPQKETDSREFPGSPVVRTQRKGAQVQTLVRELGSKKKEKRKKKEADSICYG